jgi:NAD(P)-dependent dehydrogenase (short-subunit alcohol dehydrogenase family)
VTSRLAGKVAVVTGGGGGIGGATARTLAREGASVVVIDVDGDRAAAVELEITQGGGHAMAIQADVSQEDPVIAAVGRIIESFGHLDVLHNNAALTDHDSLSRDTTVTELELEVWERTMAVNLRSQMLMCKHVVPEMVRGGGGSIINMSSGAALKGDRTRTAYGVSKAGVSALTGLIITEAVKAHLTESMVAGLGRATLTPYVGQPEDVADLVLFLASDESRYITGQMIAIDGGMSAHV